MRYSFFLMSFACLAAGISSCTDSTAEASIPLAKGTTIHTLPVGEERIKGTYTGDFKGSPIAITLRYVSGRNISGYNVHKGLKRNITGTIEVTGNQLLLKLNEPGSNPHDGSFELFIDTTTWQGNGKFVPFKNGQEARFSFRKAQESENEGIQTIYMDSLLNTLELNADGSCKYSYVLNDSTATAQKLTIKGNYQLDKDSTVQIHWQKNDVFPGRKSLFKFSIESYDSTAADKLKTLKGEGMTFTEFYY